MRTLFVIMFVLVLGGGFYWYSQQSEVSKNVDPIETMDTVTLPPVTTPVNTPSTADSTNAAPVKEFTITNSGMVFSEKTMTVKKGDRVKIVYKNGGGTHDFRIDGYNIGTKVLTIGQSETVEFVADKAGAFEFYCSVGSHRALGMKGAFTVTN